MGLGFGVWGVEFDFRGVEFGVGCVQFGDWGLGRLVSGLVVRVKGNRSHGRHVSLSRMRVLGLPHTSSAAGGHAGVSRDAGLSFSKQGSKRLKESASELKP